MSGHAGMPLGVIIAIGGGCAALVVLLGIALARGRRRTVELSRKTSFHAVAIDPTIAEQGRAAFETTSPQPAITPYVPAPVSLAIDPPARPRRYARGSTPGIERGLPARPQGWEQHEPSVTAQMRAARRSH